MRQSSSEQFTMIKRSISARGNTSHGSGRVSSATSTIDRGSKNDPRHMAHIHTEREESNKEIGLLNTPYIQSPYVLQANIETAGPMKSHWHSIRREFEAIDDEYVVDRDENN